MSKNRSFGVRLLCRTSSPSDTAGPEVRVGPDWTIIRKEQAKNNKTQICSGSEGIRDKFVTKRRFREI
jgi:hypothetical protein